MKRPNTDPLTGSGIKSVNEVRQVERWERKRDKPSNRKEWLLRNPAVPRDKESNIRLTTPENSEK